MKRIYLAAPYSHESEEVRKERVIWASSKAAEIMKEGDLVFSPISHGHLIETCGNVAGDAKTWEAFNDSIIKGWATHVYVLRLYGWEESRGIAHEIKLAEKIGLPVEFVEA